MSIFKTLSYTFLKVINDYQTLFSPFQKKLEDAKAQMQFLGLDKELKELKKAIVASDKLAATELSLAKDQLKALHGTVLKINQERAEVNSSAQGY